jgi:hypothetical protein
MRNFIITVDNRINDIRMDINRVFGIDTLRGSGLLRLRLYCQHAAAKLCHAVTKSKRDTTTPGGLSRWFERVVVSMRMASVPAPAWQPIPALPCPRRGC